MEARLGLGFSSSPLTDDEGEAQSTAVAGDMLKNLMQQCFAYHRQQQQPEPPQYPPPQYPPTAATTTTNNGVSSVPQHISIDRSPMVPPRPDSSNLPPESPIKKEPDINQVAQEGRARANAILEKFQALSRQHGVMAVEGAVLLEDTIHGTASAIITAPSVFREKREACFAQETQRKNQFWVKNLEYVTKRDERRLQQQLQQVNEAQQWETQVQEQYRQALEERKKRLRGGNNSNNSNLTTQAGLGTAKRKRVEKEKNRTILPSSSSRLQQQQDIDSSVSVYLTGIPTNGSITENTLHSLFTSYGTIRKVHFYRDRQTGNLKGDALVVFQVEKEEKDTLLQMVCSQMNGAELPCGAILQVEPAQQSYQPKQPSQYGPASSSQQNHPEDQQDSTMNAGNSVEARETKEGEDGDEDLDDFFESLS